jgi:hypothetical protein
MKNLMVLPVYFITLNLCNFIQAQDLSLQLNVINPVLNKIEPIFYELELVNNRKTLKHIIHPWNSNFSPCLESYNEKLNIWEKIPGSGKRQIIYQVIPWQIKTPELIYIKAGEHFKASFNYIGIYGDYASSNRYVFENKDSLKIRAVYSVNKEASELVYSNVVKISFTDYSGEDSLALNYLESLSVPHFIYHSLLDYRWEEEYSNMPFISQASHLVSAFPNSKFAVWAYLGLAKIEGWVYDVENKTIVMSRDAIIRAENFIKKGLEHGDTTCDPYFEELYSLILVQKMYSGLSSLLEIGDYLEYLNEFFLKRRQ